MIGEIVRCDTCGAPNDFDADLCNVCHHPLGEAGGCGSAGHQLALHPAVRFRFADVVGELHAIAAMARHGTIDPGSVEAACRRAESLLLLLRRQFLEDVVFSEHPPSARRPA